VKALRVKRQDAGKAVELMEILNLRDKRRLITSKDDYVEVPIVECDLNSLKEVANFDFKIVEQKKPVYARARTLRDAIRQKLSESEMKKLENLLPSTYKVIGDVILVKIPEELKDYAKIIGEALLEINPHCKSVWWDRGKRGMLRKPEVKIIAGKGGETVHREGGCVYKFDVSKVMFSPGNQAERIRMGTIVGKEVVVDMFAGIGYFTIPMAKKAKVYAIEINPESYHYLLENIKLNGVEGRVIPILGNSMFVTPERVADRVVMGHINCHEFLPVAVRALRDRGWIHYHESVPEAVLERPIRRIISAVREEGKRIKINCVRKVKNYSPGVIHVVIDAYIY
jgi:tRNA wybutosine-synthesizing protein 2